MDIQRGEFPRVVPLTETIKIGETLSVLVFLRDPRIEYDLIVRDCWAFDHPDYDAKTTGRIQLSDKIGCSRKKKIFGTWRRTTETGNTGATLILHNTLQAFKFPDRMQVFLKCDVEVILMTLMLSMMSLIVFIYFRFVAESAKSNIVMRSITQ